MVCRLTPSSAARSTSAGSAEPAGTSPEAISRRRPASSWLCSGPSPLGCNSLARARASRSPTATPPSLALSVHDRLVHQFRGASGGAQRHLRPRWRRSRGARADVAARQHERGRWCQIRRRRRCVRRRRGRRGRRATRKLGSVPRRISTPAAGTLSSRRRQVGALDRFDAIRTDNRIESHAVRFEQGHVAAEVFQIARVAAARSRSSRKSRPACRRRSRRRTACNPPRRVRAAAPRWRLRV